MADVVGVDVAVEVGVLLWHDRNVPSTNAVIAPLKLSATASQLPCTSKVPPGLQVTMPGTSGRNVSIMRLIANADSAHFEAPAWSMCMPPTLVHAIVDWCTPPPASAAAQTSRRASVYIACWSQTSPPPSTIKYLNPPRSAHVACPCTGDVVAVVVNDVVGDVVSDVVAVVRTHPSKSPIWCASTAALMVRVVDSQSFVATKYPLKVHDKAPSSAPIVNSATKLLSANAVREQLLVLSPRTSTLALLESATALCESEPNKTPQVSSNAPMCRNCGSKKPTLHSRPKLPRPTAPSVHRSSSTHLPSTSALAFLHTVHAPARGPPSPPSPRLRSHTQVWQSMLHMHDSLARPSSSFAPVVLVPTQKLPLCWATARSLAETPAFPSNAPKCTRSTLPNGWHSKLIGCGVVVGVVVAVVEGDVDADVVAVVVAVDDPDVVSVLVAVVVGDVEAVVVGVVLCVDDGVDVRGVVGVLVPVVVGVLLWHEPKVPSTKALKASLKLPATALQSPSTWKNPSGLHPTSPPATGWKAASISLINRADCMHVPTLFAITCMSSTSVHCRAAPSLALGSP